ncbi:hypothetical protein AAEI00_21830, partial [Shewanella algae]|uniref:hypothetical protein n=1 Tax=Shewanella algae TaxID=38313 RepID=UPI00319CD8A9
REDGLDGALRFDTLEEADSIVRMVRQLYGENNDLAVIQDPPAEGGEWTQKALDKFLPAWAYARKYSSFEL